MAASIEELIYSRLAGFAGLAALVGTRIYPNELPQDVAKPAIRFRLIADDVPQPQQVTGATDLVRARYQFDAFAPAYDDARDVRDQIKLALKRWSSAGPPVVQVAFYLSSVDLFERDTGLHNCSSDFEINYEE